MITLLSMVLFAMQGLAGQQVGNGTLSGMVRDVSGRPLVGARVAARAANGTRTAPCRDTLIGESETDKDGRYRLDVPPGQYYIVVRLLERTTYYPAAAFTENATSVAITSATIVDSLNITVPNANSAVGRDGRDRDLYTAAVENLRLDCFPAARLQLQVLAETFEDSEYQSDAQYLFAESFYREGTPAALVQAEKQFTNYIAFFPNSPRIPEARKRLADIQQR
jgi:hypothetical protein